MYNDLSNEELFGPSDYSETSDSESNNEVSPCSFNEPINNISYTTFPSISGLILYENLLSHKQQNELINGIVEANYFDNPESNQAMCFGTLPSFLLNAIEIISRVPGLFPDEIQNREPLFDQSIINLYKPGEGIASHVDLPRFEDGIVVISLLSSCVMQFKPLSVIEQGDDNNDNASYYNKFKDIQNTDEPIPIILRPGSVLALSGSSRYNWTHGIEENEIDEAGDEKIIRNIRVSVTLRKMKQDQLLLNKDDSNSFSLEVKKREH
ncbi:alkylated DNA repair protein alkB homolog 8 [Rhizophagus clarus]|uniref:Alkylated DNA repair protein alkB homolog 8 n=1 Tax=Rhizophagus clarus TaxID=94130 RepID=A0A8H3LSK9_9GLOM|nr:alkylated DNA repair protein alkB homolog 8 [Rhizophagus clarus]